MTLNDLNITYLAGPRRLAHGTTGAVARCHALMEDITDFEVAELSAELSFRKVDFHDSRSAVPDQKHKIQ